MSEEKRETTSTHFSLGISILKGDPSTLPRPLPPLLLCNTTTTTHKRSNNKVAMLMEDEDMSLATMVDEEEEDDIHSINGGSHEEFPEDLTSLLASTNKDRDEDSSGGSDVFARPLERYERPNVRCM